ncbi:MAG: hypothetical protein ACRCRT_02170, partial [Cetobacterium somerae]
SPKPSSSSKTIVNIRPSKPTPSRPSAINVNTKKTNVNKNTNVNLNKNTNINVNKNTNVNNTKVINNTQVVNNTRYVETGRRRDVLDTAVDLAIINSLSNNNRTTVVNNHYGEPSTHYVERESTYVDDRDMIPVQEQTVVTKTTVVRKSSSGIKILFGLLLCSIIIALIVLLSRRDD